MVPLIAVGLDKIRPSSLSNRSVQFLLFQTGASSSSSICVPTNFDDSAGESTTSHLSNMKKGGSGVNRYGIDKNNIIRPTFNTLTEDDRKALETYRTDLDEFFYSHYEVTRQGLVFKDTTPIIIRKAEVTHEVRSNPSLSLDDV
jgi:hypothetical protein